MFSLNVATFSYNVPMFSINVLMFSYNIPMLSMNVLRIAAIAPTHWKDGEEQQETGQLQVLL
jgi:hypothetical protein